jgi:TRAP-type C4-dicarboxylate transport system permease small subunit
MNRIINSVLEKILVFLMALMVINVLWQILARYIPVLPGSFTDELARYLLIWVGVLGAAYASGQHMHLALDLLPEKLKGAAKSRLYILINFLVGTFALLVMVIGGIRLMYITLYLEQTSAALGIPLGYVYMVLPLSGLLIIYYSVRHSLYLLKDIKSHS